MSALPPAPSPAPPDARSELSSAPSPAPPAGFDLETTGNASGLRFRPEPSREPPGGADGLWAGLALAGDAPRARHVAFEEGERCGRMSDSDDESLLGTHISDDEGDSAGRNRRLQARRAADPSRQALATTKPWQQEVLDEQGRQRFHGAFTGGFSAGYYNTAGSAEGWEPAPFVSERQRRARADAAAEGGGADDDYSPQQQPSQQQPSQQQRREAAPEDFMDEEDLAGYRKIGTTERFAGIEPARPPRRTAAAAALTSTAGGGAGPGGGSVAGALGRTLEALDAAGGGGGGSGIAVGAVPGGLRAGERLLRRLGWRGPGFGLGPRVAAARVYGAALPPGAAPRGARDDGSDGGGGGGLTLAPREVAAPVWEFKRDRFGLGYSSAARLAESALHAAEDAQDAAGARGAWGLGALEDGDEELPGAGAAHVGYDKLLLLPDDDDDDSDGGGGGGGGGFVMMGGGGGGRAAKAGRAGGGRRARDAERPPLSVGSFAVCGHFEAGGTQDDELGAHYPPPVVPDAYRAYHAFADKPRAGAAAGAEGEGAEARARASGADGGAEPTAGVAGALPAAFGGRGAHAPSPPPPPPAAQPGRPVVHALSAAERGQLLGEAGLPPAPPPRPPWQPGRPPFLAAGGQPWQPGQPPPEPQPPAGLSVPSSLKPYSARPEKQTRFDAWLESSRTGRPLSWPAAVAAQTRVAEASEFEKVCLLFGRPQHALIAARFTSAGAEFTAKPRDEAADPDELPPPPPPVGLWQPTPKPRAPAGAPAAAPPKPPPAPAPLSSSNDARAAAAAGLFGRLTRAEEPWAPAPLLCKRFGMAPPEAQAGPAGPAKLQTYDNALLPLEARPPSPPPPSEGAPRSRWGARAPPSPPPTGAPGGPAHRPPVAPPPSGPPPAAPYAPSALPPGASGAGLIPDGEGGPNAAAELEA
ncbi:hypothetical protein T492DRAFT_904270, partial [Pavlovales sp. CCMP2436]